MVTMPMQHRIVLVSELFYPDKSATAYILTKIACQLKLDFKLLVLTTTVALEKDAHHTKASLLDHYCILRIWSPRMNKNKVIERIIGFLALTISLSWKTILKSRRTDIVFAVTNPAPLLVALAIIRKVRRFKLVLLVHDVFPENAVAAGLIRSDHFFYSFIKRIFDWAYESADAIITIGQDMSEVIAQKIPRNANKITLIENWADYPLLEKISRNQSIIPSMGFSDRIVIQYAGNIGRTQGIIEFVKTVSIVRNDVVRFIFRGSGAMSAKLNKITEGKKNFILGGPYPRSEQHQILNACDIALVILKPDMYGLGVPSKTYNILAVGKPILFLGPRNSEIYRLVRENDVGWAFEWSEVNQLVEWIDQLSLHDLEKIENFGCNARKLAETKYAEHGQLTKFSSFFKNFTYLKCD